MYFFFQARPGFIINSRKKELEYFPKGYSTLLSIVIPFYSGYSPGKESSIG
jgi:hypothetical protein